MILKSVRTPVGTLEFFDELEQYRYQKMPFLRDYVQFPQYKGKKVLEIGCGPGIDTLQFAKGGADVWAVDLTSRAIELTRSNLSLHGFDDKVQQINQGNAEKLDFPDETFDVVYSNGVLHHTEDTERSIEEVRRVLKPGGEAVIMLYNRWSWFNLLAIWTRTNIEHEEEDAPIIRRYSTGDCRRMFKPFGGPIDIHVDRFPEKTLKFKGFKGILYNSVFVPIWNFFPKSIVRPFGWHIMIRAKKGT